MKILARNFFFLQNISMSKCGTISKHEKTMSEMSEVRVERINKIDSLTIMLHKIRKKYQNCNIKKDSIDLKKKWLVKTKD